MTLSLARVLSLQETHLGCSSRMPSNLQCFLGFFNMDQVRWLIWPSTLNTCMKLNQVQVFSYHSLEVDNKLQGWRTHQDGRFTHKTDAYKWLNHDKDGTYKSNHINSPIGWQLLVINQLKSNLNTHSCISTVNTEMKAGQIRTKEIIFKNDQNEKLTIV